MLSLRRKAFSRWSATAAIALGVAVVGLAASPAPAHARGGVHFFVGLPLYAPHPYYAPPPVVYPAPYYYAPPPTVVYSAPPAYVAPAPVESTSAPYTSNGQTCREFQSTIQIDGTAQPSHGTACLQSDGTWRIVR